MCVYHGMIIFFSVYGDVAKYLVPSFSFTPREEEEYSAFVKF